MFITAGWEVCQW